LAVLDERWPAFLCRAIGQEAPEGQPFTVPGPSSVPFEHPDVHAYVDDLFLDGRLTRTTIVSRVEVPDAWMQAGVQADEQDLDVEVRFAELTGVIHHKIPAADATYHEWRGFARLWAEWLVNRHKLTPAQLAVGSVDVESLHDEVEQRYAAWMIKCYAALPSVSHGRGR
jgi:hypothetical protein